MDAASNKQCCFFARWEYWWLGLRTWFASTVRKRLPSDRLLFLSRRKVYVTWPSSSKHVPEYRSSRRGWRWLGGGETTSSAERLYTRAWILPAVILLPSSRIDPNDSSLAFVVVFLFGKKGNPPPSFIQSFLSTFIYAKALLRDDFIPRIGLGKTKFPPPLNSSLVYVTLSRYTRVFAGMCT